jgi:hypothetical protein
VSSVEPELAEVLRRGDVRVPPEGELGGADGHEGGRGDVGGGEVAAGVLVDERDRAPQGGRGAAEAVLRGEAGQRAARGALGRVT